MNMGRSLRERATLLGRLAKRVLRFGSEDGGALVEFAVTLPLFMTVLTGTASFSPTATPPCCCGPCST